MFEFKMRKYIVTVVVILSSAVIGCKKEVKNDVVEKENTLFYTFNFPETVYTNKTYLGKISFTNIILDEIAEPRVDTANFRFLIYKPFEPVTYGTEFEPVYKDSVLLEDKEIDFELKFDKPGIYSIGGLARDGIMIGYYNNGIRDSVRIIEHEVIMFKKVVVRDSI